MAAKILDGKAIAQDIRAELKEKTAELKKQGIVPGLGVLLVGEDPAPRSYVTAKEKACEETGLYSKEIKLPATATTKRFSMWFMRSTLMIRSTAFSSSFRFRTPQWNNQ